MYFFCRSTIKHVGLRWVSCQALRNPIRHAGLRPGMSVSDEACWSSMRHAGFQSDMLVSDGSMMGLQSEMSVADGSPNVIIFSCTHIYVHIMV